MPDFLNYEKYHLAKTLDDKCWCEQCQYNEEYTIIMPEKNNLPAFVICWNCHTIKQVGVGQLRDAEQRNGAEAGGTTEACSASTHDFLREKAGHRFCYKCGKRLLP